MSPQIIALRKAYLMLTKYEDIIVDNEPEQEKRDELNDLIVEIEKLINP